MDRTCRSCPEGSSWSDSVLELQSKQSSSKKFRSWRVIHACENARDVLPVIEGQIHAGMRPFIVTPYGAASGEVYLAQPSCERPHSLSLLRAWQDVRNWRKSLLDCDAENSADLV